MARVLKIASRLMGVLLLMLVGVMGAGRYQKTDPDAIIIHYIDYTQCPDFQVALFVAELSYLRRIDRYSCTQLGSGGYRRFFGGEKWAYFADCDLKPLSEPHCRLDQVNVMTGRTTTIIPIFADVGLHLTQDRAWWVYMTWDENGQLIWERRRFDGSDPLNLTDTIDAHFPLGNHLKSMLSPDQAWIYVEGQDANGIGDIYRLRLDGTAWENLTATIDDSISLYISGDLPSRNQVPISNDKDLFYMSYDGQEINPFEEWYVRTDATAQSDELVMLVNSDTRHSIIGVSMKNGKVLWEMKNRHLITMSPDGQWLFFSKRDHSIQEIMRWDGSEHRVFDKALAMNYGQWNETGTWYFFKRFNRINNNGVDELWRLRADGYMLEKIFSTPFVLNLQRETPDGKWFIFQTDGDSTIYRMHPDGTQIEPLHILDNLSNVSFVAMSPKIGHKWQPSILAAILITPLRRRCHPAKR